MKFAVICGWLVLLTLGGCSWAPRAGPSQHAVLHRAGPVAFDVVKIDRQVIAAVRAHGPYGFSAHFKNRGTPPVLKIAVGDTLSVVIAEASREGLFGASLLRPPVAEPGDRLAQAFGEATAKALRDTMAPSQLAALETSLAQNPLSGTTVPDQQVGRDGRIGIPYAGRIVAAGRSPAQLQRAIERRLTGKAIAPQVLVLVTRSAANSVSVEGDAVTGARVTLSPHGERLLQVIAAAGGAHGPLRDVTVRLSRNGITAAVPLGRLVADPAEDIYARPGDVLTLTRRPQTLSVFGAVPKNAAITFDSDRVTLAEALAKAGGLLPNRADPENVFLFRYEPYALVRALGEPLAADAANGVSPIVYRLDLGDANSYLLARQFPVRDRDIIFVANAASDPLYKVIGALSQVTGPVVTGLLTCHTAKC